MSESKTQSRLPGGVRGIGGGGPARFAAMGAKAKDFRGTMRQLISYLKPFRFVIIFVWILALLSTA